MKKVAAHKLIVKTAKEMAEALFEEVMSGSNEMYADWKNQFPEKSSKERQEIFVQAIYPKLLEPARAILAHMLGQPQYAHLHESIYDALLKDYPLAHGRQAAHKSRPRITVQRD